jgi:hypothetical protein
MKKIHLALTIGLMNRSNPNILQAAKQLMSGFNEEAGSFLGLTELGASSLGRKIHLKQYALRFEKYTLELDVVDGPTQDMTSVQGLRLR